MFNDEEKNSQDSPSKVFENVDIEGVSTMLDVLDYIDKKLEAYKRRYLKFKEKAIKDLERKQKKFE